MSMLQSRGLIPVGTTPSNKCENDNQCDKEMKIDDKDTGVWQGLKCQKALDPYGEYDLPGKYCCISTGAFYCENSKECCNRDCDKSLYQCITKRKPPPK